MLQQHVKDKIIELRNSGLGLRAIGTQLGLKRDTVRTFLRTKYAQERTYIKVATKKQKPKSIRNCEYCGDNYYVGAIDIKSHKFCSSKCRANHTREKELRNYYSCITCGSKFKPNGSQKYCSDECSYRKDNCVVCGNEFKVKIASKVKHCSLMCSKQKYRKTHEEYCNKLLSIHKGNITPITFYVGSDNDITIHCLLCNKQTTGIAHKFIDSVKRKGCAHCGPRLSLAEDEINEWLQQNNVKYVSQYRFIDNDEMSKLRYDFAILNEDDSVKMLIEYDGVQHFRVVDRFGGKDEYVTRKERDRIKDNYARDMGIKLIRINYKQRNNIDSILRNVMQTTSPIPIK